MTTPATPLPGTARRRATAWGFVVGSALFAAGVPLSETSGLSPALAGWTFFAGSLFFTTAAALQLLTSREELPPIDAAGGREWFTALLRPRTADWTASALQFLGTLAFNVSTYQAAVDAAGTTGPYDLVWRPNAVGSVLFLVSSGMAFAPEVRRRRHLHVRDRSWAIAALNLLGSLFFGLSALGAYLVPGTAALLNVQWANGGTFLGAACFLVGAALLLPPRGA